MSRTPPVPENENSWVFCKVHWSKMSHSLKIRTVESFEKDNFIQQHSLHVNCCNWEWCMYNIMQWFNKKKSCFRIAPNGVHWLVSEVRSSRHHTSYLSFFYTTTFWGLQILHSKVRKFAIKIASRQNSVNHTTEKITHRV